MRRTSQRIQKMVSLSRDAVFAVAVVVGLFARCILEGSAPAPL